MTRVLMQWDVKNETALRHCIEDINSLARQKKFVVGVIEPEISPQQFKALHVFCQKWADQLNNSGISRVVTRVISGQQAEVEWTKEAFKEDVYKVVLEALEKVKSTKDQTTTSPDVVARNINEHLCKKYHWVKAIEWPSKR